MINFREFNWSTDTLFSPMANAFQSDIFPLDTLNTLFRIKHLATAGNGDNRDDWEEKEIIRGEIFKMTHLCSERQIFTAK